MILTVDQKGLSGLSNSPDQWKSASPKESASAGSDHYSIGDLAREFNVTLRALRFYESKGLLKPRREGNLRLYSVKDRETLAQILKGKQLGFTLNEIRGLIAGEEQQTGALGLKLSREQCIEQIKLLERQKKEMEDAIAELRRNYTDLYTRTKDPE
jgi:DNA-binding transcriptional MerR regulator